MRGKGSKSLGTTNPHNVVKATFDAFAKLDSWAHARRLRRQVTGAAAAAEAPSS